MLKFNQRRKVIILFVFLVMVCNGLATIFAEKTSHETVEKPLKRMYVKGVVDRIEHEDLAVILVEELELEFVVLLSEFEIKLAPNIWVDIQLEEEEIIDITIDWVKTKEEEEKVKELVKKLKENND